VLLDGPLPDLCDLGVIDLDFVDGAGRNGGQRREYDDRSNARGRSPRGLP
jgi:hypothetical protein